MKELIFDKDYAKLEFDKEKNVLELTWKRWVKSHEYREAFTISRDFIVKNGVSNWISDIRNQGVIAPGDSQWLTKEVLPHVIKAGLNKIAVIMDKDIFKKYYVNNIERAESFGGLTMHYFDSMEHAEEWLEEDVAA
jgi:hypothetical protein